MVFGHPLLGAHLSPFLSLPILPLLSPLSLPSYSPPELIRSLIQEKSNWGHTKVSFQLNTFLCPSFLGVHTTQAFFCPSQSLLLCQLSRSFNRVAPCSPWSEIWHPTGFSGGSDGKESACNAGDLGSISGSSGRSPGLGRSPGEGNINLLQCSCLGNPMDRGAWWGPWGYKESNTTKQLMLSLFHKEVPVNWDSGLWSWVLVYKPGGHMI